MDGAAVDGALSISLAAYGVFGVLVPFGLEAWDTLEQIEKWRI